MKMEPSFTVKASARKPKSRWEVVFNIFMYGYPALPRDPSYYDFNSSSIATSAFRRKVMPELIIDV